MTIDFYKYLFLLNKRQAITLIINVIIFLISLSSMIQNITDFGSFDIFVGVIFIFSIFNVTWDIIGKISDIKSFIGNEKEIELNKKITLTKENVNFQLKDIQAESREGVYYENFDFNSADDNNRVIRSLNINEHLWDTNFSMVHSQQRYNRIFEFIVKNRVIITPFIKYQYYNSVRKQQMFFNEDKLCMGSDLTMNNKAIKYYKSNYYNSFLTNEISTKVLKRTEDATVLYDASNFYPAELGNSETVNIQPLEKSAMSNHIGASTLAVSADNYLIIRRQGKNAQQNQNKLISTGSGSCDFSDLKNENLNDTVEYAMNRELWEENGGDKLGIKIDEIGETKVIGYYRVLSRGGKPEFAGITKLNWDYSDLVSNKNELIDISNSADTDTYYLESVESIPNAIKSLKNQPNISTSLYMCIDALEYYYLKRPDELKAFLML